MRQEPGCDVYFYHILIRILGYLDMYYWYTIS